ncbi:TM2 domain-containing protein 3 [Cichlidogyrus casuarinus]|uniref:TM2 domain-containing protein 3 n=1 Tax=Cichlidogyrus casuarinus TaxID=1844966 RepID=A0ABD2PZK7_9PLAT
MLPCSWKSDKSYISTFFYSVFLGGFGADRFYLGHTNEGFGKLLSVGGLGVWSIVDFILIAIGYVKPPAGENYND